MRCFNIAGRRSPFIWLDTSTSEFSVRSFLPWARVLVPFYSCQLLTMVVHLRRHPHPWEDDPFVRFDGRLLSSHSFPLPSSPASPSRP